MKNFMLYLLCSTSLLLMAASYPIPLPGASGNVMKSNGSKWTSDTVATSSLSSFNDLENVGFSATISTNTLVVALKQADGSTDCSTGAASCLVGFRSATTTSGGYSQGSFTAANSITLGTTDSIGATAAVSWPIYVYLVSDTTSEICLSVKLFDDGAVQSASALTGGADTGATALWCVNAHTSKSIKLIGQFYATFSNPNWGSVASVQLSSPSRKSGSVSSNSSGLERVERATISCSSGSSVTLQSGNWITAVGNVSSGNCGITIAAGIFSGTPSCTSTMNAAYATLNVGSWAVGNSATSIDVGCRYNTSGSTTVTDCSNNPINIICMGPR